jgi:TP901 family phage tail tape measure protein
VASPASVLNLMVVANTAPANAALLGTQARLRATANTARMSGKTMAKAFAGVGLAAGAAGVALFKVGQEFDDAYDKIRTQTGATGKEMVKLKRSFRDVVSDVPTDFDNAGKAIGELNTRLGLSGKPLDRMAKQMLELSRLTETDLSTNISNVSRAFVDWEVSTKDQTKTLDGFFRLSQKSGLAVADIAANVQKFGSPLRQLGFTLDEAAAMFASFERAGVNIQTMVPGLKLAISNLTRPTETLAVSMKKLGIEAGNPERALKQVFAILSDKNLDQITKTGLAMDVFGKRAGADMAEAVSQGRFELDKFLKVMNNGQGTILETGRKTRDLSEHFQVFLNNVKLAVEPLAKDVFKGLSNLMKEITAAFKQGGIEEVGNLLARKLEEAIPKVLEAGVKLGAKLGEAVLKGFLNAPLWVQFATAAFLLRGPILSAFAAAGTALGGKLAAAIGARLAAAQTGTMLANSLAIVGWGPVGAAIGVAIGLGIATYLGTKVGPKLADTMKSSIESEDFANAALFKLKEGLPAFRSWAAEVKEAGNKVSVQLVNDWKKAGLVTKNQAEVMKEAIRSVRAKTTEELKKTSSAFTGMSNDARHALHGVSEDTRKHLGDAADTGTDKADKLRDGVAGSYWGMSRASIKAIGKMAGETNKTLDSLKVKEQVYTPEAPSSDEVMAFHQKGGIMSVPGTGTGDKVPAMLEPGEVVVNKRAVAAMGGPHRVNRINKVIPRFAEGGVISGDTGGLNSGIMGLLNQLYHRFGGSVTSGQRPGTLHQTGNAADYVPDNFPGAAAAVNRVGAQLLEGIYNPTTYGGPAVSWDNGQNVPSSFWGSATWGDHWDHIHIATTGVAGAISAVVDKIKGMVLRGPDGPLKSMGQEVLNRVRTGANEMIARMMPTQGVEGSVASAYRGPLDRVFPRHPTGTSGAQLSSTQMGEIMAGARLPAAMKGVAWDESAWMPGIFNSADGGAGLWQITSPYNTDVMNMFGGYDQMFNPVKNALAARVILNRQPNAWAPSGNAVIPGGQLGGIVAKLAGGGTISIGSATGTATFGTATSVPPPGGSGYGYTLIPPEYEATMQRFRDQYAQYMEHIENAQDSFAAPGSAFGTGLSESERKWMLALSQERYNVGQSLRDHLVYARSWGGYDDETMAEFYSQITDLQGITGSGGSLAGDRRRIAEYQQPSDQALALPSNLRDLINRRAYIEEQIELREGRFGRASSAWGESVSPKERDALLERYRALLATLQQTWYGLTSEVNRLRPMSGTQDVVADYREQIRELVGRTGSGGSIGATKAKIADLKEMDFTQEIRDRKTLLLQKSLALATLTPGMDDDILAQSRLVGHYSYWFTRARASGDSAQIIQAANDLKNAQETLQDMKMERALGGFRRDLALAGLTPDFADDIAAQQQVASFWRRRLDSLMSSGTATNAQIAEAAENLKSARDALTSMRGEGDDGLSAELLKTLLQQANIRTAISQAQYGVLDQFQQGTGFVPQTGPYMLHRGEAVIPANQNGAEVVVYVNGDIVNVPSGRSPVEVEGAKAIVQRGSRGYGRRPLPGAVGR